MPTLGSTIAGWTMRLRFSSPVCNTEVAAVRPGKTGVSAASASAARAAGTVRAVSHGYSGTAAAAPPQAPPINVFGKAAE